MAIIAVKALDTNILIRRIARDDPDQVARAEEELRSGAIFICNTVFMEIEWVLRSIYKWPRSRIAAALAGILTIDNATVEFEDALAWAIERYAGGADFADMVHLIGSRDAEEFVTFDKTLARKTDAPLIPIRLA